MAKGSPDRTTGCLRDRARRANFAEAVALLDNSSSDARPRAGNELPDL